jgi:hypothetical protein
MQSQANELTDENTRPITVVANFDALYPATAVPYSTCFEVGAWFKWNFPATASPP